MSLVKIIAATKRAGNAISKSSADLARAGKSSKKAAKKKIKVKVGKTRTIKQKPSRVKVTHTDIERRFSPPVDDAKRIKASGGQNPHGQ